MQYMSTYVINDIEAARALAWLLGIDVPDGKGRFPFARLRTAAIEHGHDIDLSNYSTATVSTEPYYEVSGFARIGNKDAREFVTTMLSASDIRKFESAKRGRLSESATAEAAANLNNWREFEMTNVLQIGKLHVD